MSLLASKWLAWCNCIKYWIRLRLESLIYVQMLLPVLYWANIQYTLAIFVPVFILSLISQALTLFH